MRSCYEKSTSSPPLWFTPPVNVFFFFSFSFFKNFPRHIRDSSMMRSACDVVNTSMKCTLLLLQLIRGTQTLEGNENKNASKSNEGKIVISRLISFRARNNYWYFLEPSTLASYALNL